MSTAVVEAMNGAAVQMQQTPKANAVVLPGGSACPSLSQALAAARDRCKAASKDGNNTFHKYQYASADEVIATAAEALSGSGLAIIPVSEELTVISAGARSTYALNRTLILSHSSGEFTPLEIRGWPVIEDRGRPLDKAYATALTGSLAYKLRDLLQMPRGDQFGDDMNQRDDRDHIPGTADESQPPAKHNPAAAVKTLKDAGLPVQFGSEVQPPAKQQQQPQLPPSVKVSPALLKDITDRLGGEWMRPDDFCAAFEVAAPEELPASRALEALGCLRMIGDIEEEAARKGVPYQEVIDKAKLPNLFAAREKDLVRILKSMQKAEPRDIPT